MKHLLHHVKYTNLILQRGVSMSIVAQVSNIMQELFHSSVNQKVQELGVVQRIRKLPYDLFIQTLVYGWFEKPDASYADLANTAQDLGVHISRQAIAKRMTPETAKLLKATLEGAATQVLTARTQYLPIVDQFTGVYVQDSTWIALPDELHTLYEGPRNQSKRPKSFLKLQLCFDVLTGTFHHFDLTDGITPDSKAAEQFSPLPEGSLCLADLGYFSLDAFDKMTQKGIFWISKFKAKCKLFDELGEPLCLTERLLSETLDTLDLNCYIGATKKLPIRLVALRLSEAQANSQRRAIRREGKRRGITPSKERLKHAEGYIFITNVDATRLSVEQIAVILRIRWQVELLFKCFKSVGRVDKSRREKPYSILCEVYAKLITQLLRHWIMIASGWRCIHHNIIKTAKLITQYARQITISFGQSKTALRKTLEEIKRTLQKSEKRIRNQEKNTTLEHLKAVENP